MPAKAERTWPDKLGAFDITGVLGQGASAIVYDARMNERAVALKVVRPDANARDRARLLEEARLMSRVAHPAIIELLEADVLPDGRPYLALQRLDGETLAARLRRGPLSIEHAVSLFEQLAGALEALHEEGLLHRDLKPENILLIDEGHSLKLLDLGIAKEATAGPSTTTRAGAVRGTPATMAPERFFGAPASERSEVYEAALLLYAMLVGELPWVTTADIQSRLNPRSPIEAGAAVPVGLSTLLMRALSTRPERRPPTVRELVASVREEASSHAKVDERVTKSIARVDEPVSRKRGFLVGLACVGIGAWLVYRSAQAEPSEPARTGLTFVPTFAPHEQAASVQTAAPSLPSASSRARAPNPPAPSVIASGEPEELQGGVHAKPPYARDAGIESR